jgi:hypothetical protein
MIQIQILPIKNLPAKLARILVPLENIVPRELHLFLWHAIK